MTALWLIAAMFCIIYLFRLSGLLAHRFRIPESWERALGFAPIAVLAALAATSLAAQSSGDPLRLVAAAGAGAIMLKVRRMWACIMGGFGLYLALNVIVP